MSDWKDSSGLTGAIDFVVGWAKETKDIYDWVKKKTEEIGIVKVSPQSAEVPKDPKAQATEKKEEWKEGASIETKTAKTDLLKQHILGKLNTKIPDLVKRLKDVGAIDTDIKKIVDKADKLKKEIEACADDEALRKSNVLSNIKDWIQDLDNASELQKKFAGEIIADAKLSLAHIKTEIESGKLQDSESTDETMKIATDEAPKNEKQAKKDFVDSLKKYGIPAMAATSVASVFWMFGAFAPHKDWKDWFFAGIAKFFSDPANTIKWWFGVTDDKKDKVENPTEYANVQKWEIKDDTYSNGPISLSLKDKKIEKIKIGNQEYKIQSLFGMTERFLWAASFGRENNCDYLKLGDKKVNLSKLVKTTWDWSKPEDEYVLWKWFWPLWFLELWIEKVA